MAGAGDRHADDVLGLAGRFLLFLGMDPGVMLPDVGHFEVILIDPGLAQGVPEQRFERSRGAGGDDHAVEPFLPGDVRDFLGRVGGARKHLLLGIDDIGQRQAVIDGGGNIHRPADIRPAVTHEDADPRLLLGDVPLRRIDALPGEPPPAEVEQLPALGAGAAGAENRLGDVDRPLERAADENPRPAGLHGVERAGLTEVMRVELDPELGRQTLDVRGRIQSHGQHHQIELFFFDALLGRRIPDGDIAGLRQLPGDGHVAADEPHPGKLLRAFVEALEVLAV